MQATILATPKPVLAFKALAASRLCETQEDARAAFCDAYAHIKPIDGLIVDRAHAEAACRAAGEARAP